MNGLLAFLGAFLAVVIVAVILVSVVTKKLKRLSNRLLRPRNIARVLSQIEVEQEALPRSLSACDSLVIPQILRDFPDFDPNLVKTYARDYLNKKFGNMPASPSTMLHIPTILPLTFRKPSFSRHLSVGRKMEKRCKSVSTSIIHIFCPAMIPPWPPTVPIAAQPSATAKSSVPTAAPELPMFWATPGNSPISSKVNRKPGNGAAVSR